MTSCYNLTTQGVVSRASAVPVAFFSIFPEHTSSKSSDPYNKIDCPEIKTTNTWLSEMPTLGKLNKSLLLHLSFVENGYTLECPDLEIFESGETAESALNEFCDFFVGDYLNWLATPDEELDNSAKELKKKYLTYLG